MTLLNPRGYLSWSQIDMWQRNKERYIKNYMLGQDSKFHNSGMEYGSKLSKGLENGSVEDDDLMSAVIALLPRYNAVEHEIKANMTTPRGDVVLLGKLDTFDTKKIRLREYKSGRIPWTQKKAEKHGQLRQYATLVWLEHKVIPDIHLDWIETEEVDGDVRFTGKMQSFHVKLTMRDILEYMATVQKVAYEIDEEYRKQLAKLT